MKLGMIALLLGAAGLVFYPIGPADATMYIDSDERRSAMFDTFLFISVIVGVLGTLFSCMARSYVPSEPEIEPSSMVVPQIKQESNIVRHIIAA
jgi:hypothetical protein